MTGTGPGFDSSRDHSEQTAKEAWLKKAQGFYSDAAWDTAKDLGLTCVKQGLYSKCFASAVPRCEEGCRRRDAEGRCAEEQLTLGVQAPDVRVGVRGFRCTGNAVEATAILTGGSPTH